MKLLDINQPFPTSDEQAIEYLPDVPAVHGIYRCRRAMGASIAEAMAKALEACIPPHILSKAKETK